MNASALRMRLASVWRATALALGLGLLPVLLSAAPKNPGEYDVKAAFLYNFIAFTDWPATAFENSASPVVIGVLGRDPFGSSLETIMKGERIRDRPLIVWRINRIEDAERCHILFISGSESQQVGEILRRLRNRPILTVSDLPGFAEAGGAVGFTTNTSVKLEINHGTVQAAHLTLSAKLLRLARLVGTTAPSP